MNTFEKIITAALAVVGVGATAGITTTTIIDKNNVEEMNANLLEQINDLQSQIDALDNKTDDLQNQINELKEQYAALKAQEQADIERVINDYTAKINAIQEQIGSVKEQLAALKEKHEADVKALKEKEQADIAALDAKYAQEVSDIKAKEAEDIRTVKADYEEKIVTLTEALKDASDELKAKINSDIALLTSEMNSKIEAIKVDYQNKIDLLTATFEGKLEAVKTDYTNKLAALQTAFETETNRLQTEINSLTSSIDDLEDALAAAIQAIKDEYDDKLEEILERIAVLEADQQIKSYGTEWIETSYFRNNKVDKLQKYRRLSETVYELSFKYTSDCQTKKEISAWYKSGTNVLTIDERMYNSSAYSNNQITAQYYYNYTIEYTRYWDSTLETANSLAYGYLNAAPSYSIGYTSPYGSGTVSLKCVFDTLPSTRTEVINGLHNYITTLPDFIDDNGSTFEASSNFTLTGATGFYNDEFISLHEHSITQKGFDINTYLGK